MNKSDKPKFTYVYDPLCGWCYGFSPVVQKIWERYQDEIDFEVISGGMVLGDREGPIGEVAAYIDGAHKQVEDRTGVKFGDAFMDGILREGSTWFSSMPPSIALAIVKKHAPEHAFPFASTLQKAIYKDGIDLNVPEAYLPYVEPLGISSEVFVQAMKDPAYQDLARQDFHFSRQLQVSGFPAAFVFLNNTYYLISRGYSDFEYLEGNLQKVMQEA
ncbi:MAG: DsbA family protein [Bacteroidetes bacterium]|nr:DsbA family protein [Bacteroidota bacterium]